MQPQSPDRCICELPTAPYTTFISTAIGCDATNGRYADVSLERCTACRRLWLRYHVEYEGFSGSGRWARGLIAPDKAAITPETAAAYIDGLDWYLRGGSYFGAAGRASGPMPWD